MIGIGEGLTFLGACLIGSVSVFKYKKNGKRAVLKSGDTIKRFMKEMEGIDGGSIRIRRVY